MQNGPRIVSLVALAVAPCLVQATCPYAGDMAARDAIPHPHPHGAVQQTRAQHQDQSQGVMLMNRIAPSTSQLYIADADGSNEQPLLSDPVFEYHGTFSPDGEWVLFTTERNGDGNADIYRVRADGSSELEALATTPAVEDAVVLSPDGTLATFVSTEGMYANIWVLDLATGKKWNVTDTPVVTASTDKSLPHGYFRPAWSPDGEWIAFSSDRNTQWLGHGFETFFGLSGWEHTQELAIYAIKPDGSGFKQIVAKEGHTLGSPSWSPDGQRIVYYEMTRETTWDAHSSFSLAGASSSIVSVDVATGVETVEVGGAGLKINPQYISNTEIGYLLKGGASEGIYTTGGVYIDTTSEMVRSPSWSPDGTKVLYEKNGWGIRAQGKPLYSWDTQWDYQFTDVFPTLSNKGQVAITQKQLGDSSVITMNAKGQHPKNVFDPVTRGVLSEQVTAQGQGGAFQPSWSTDGEWLTFGVGYWFQGRGSNGGWVVRAKADGSAAQNLTQSAVPLTNTTLNTGFPSFSHDGKQVVYRVWGVNSLTGDETQLGLRLLNIDAKGGSGKPTVLTTGWDTLPSFSPDGKRIVFTRRTGPTNYDICTIRPDGSDLRVLTTSTANDAHAVWAWDGRIMYSTGEYGFQSECALYDNTFQPYGQINIMDADGGNKRPLTNSMWEDSMPLLIPNSYLA